MFGGRAISRQGEELLRYVVSVGIGAGSWTETGSVGLRGKPKKVG